VLFPAPPQPSPPPRIVITGAGIVTALGLDWDANAEGFRRGRTAFRPVSLFDVSRQRVKTAAEVSLPDRLPRSRLSARETLRLDRAAKMLLLAAGQAWEQSRWEGSGCTPIVLGTTSGGMTLGQDYFRDALSAPTPDELRCDGHRSGADPARKEAAFPVRGGTSATLDFSRRQAARVIHYQAQRQGRDVADAFGLTGPVTVIANACASGANAIGHAWDLIRRGRAERVFAGGYDALSQLVFAGFDSLQALSPTGCRPFDAHRDGLALGEGAAVLAVETLASAERRRADILGEIVGYGAATDAHHLTQPHPEGRAALASMNAACAIAGINPAMIGYLNAHGTGTPLNDSAEAAAINTWAGEAAAHLRVSSTKAGIGHLLGAAGAVEAVVCLMALRGQWLPPEVTLQTPDPVVRFPIVREPVDAAFDFALTNSFGFGGANATLVLRRWV
jgi:3-oxoacyl-[acyl-carrier-protein] synthase II